MPDNLRPGFMVKYVTYIAKLQGWRRYILALFLGAAASLSLPPVYFLPVLYVVFPVFCWLLIDVPKKRTAFLLGWLFSFGYLAASLYWISFALLVYSEKLWWMVPFAAVGLPAFLSLYGGIAALCVCFLKTGFGRALGLAIFWWLGAWLRGHLFTGFPWNLLGQSWAMHDALIQIASVVGIYGVTLLCLLSCCLPAALPCLRGRFFWLVLIFCLSLPLGSFGYGVVRLGGAAASGKISGDLLGVRLVQTNIPQREKWQQKYQRRNFETYLKLSKKDRPAWVRLVIWPETAASFFLEESNLARRRIAEILAPGTKLLTGAPRREMTGEDYNLFNGVVALDAHGHVINSYNKSHLVPFGEYIPYKEILGLEKVTHGKKDYSAGAGPRTLDIAPDIPPFSALVCYEVIFPGAVVNDVQRPGWILNLTNDAWYGETAGPYQHLAQAKLRAIEEGLPLVRSANTGISAIYDQFGREKVRIGLNMRGVLDHNLEIFPDLNTLYSRYRDIPVWLFFFTIMIFLGLVEKVKK